MLSNGLAVVIAITRGTDRESSFHADLAGHPQIALAVCAAKSAPGIDKVWVVTDDATLSETSLRAGADRVLCDAFEPLLGLEGLLLRTVHAFAAEDAPRPELVLCLDAAFPLTRSSDLAHLIEDLHALQVDAVMAARSVAQPACSAPQGEQFVLCDPNLHAPAEREWLVETGAAYALRGTSFRSTGKLRAGRIVLHRLPTHRGLRVESALDRDLAEVVLRADVADEQRACLPKQLKAVVFDFDGVMTDNAVWVTQEGQESVRCDRGDGMGLGLLKARGIKLLILSKERNPVVTARAKKLGIECLQGIDNKLDELTRWLTQAGVASQDAVYAGNDVNDLECMRHVGCAVCPQDAHASARQASQLVLTRDGGRGAVRELCDLILESLASARDFG